MNPLVLVIIIILVIAAFGGLPAFGLLHGAGYFPSGIAGLLVLVLIILLLTGRL